MDQVDAEWHEDSRTEAERECREFIEANAVDLADLDAEMCGHDFWFTRNGHGVGFWDRGYGPKGRRLSDAADVYGAYLRGANLGGAKGIDAKTLAARISEPRPAVPTIEHIHQRLLAAVTAEGCRLKMDTWHTCETAHCRAGWIVTLAGEQGRALEQRFGPANAARMIYRESDPDFRTANFFATDEEAMKDIVACAEREKAKETT